MFFYQVYHQVIKVNIPLDQPSSQHRIPDYTILIRESTIAEQHITWLYDYDEDLEHSTPCWHRLGRLGADYLVRFTDYADFLISEEKRVILCYPAKHLQTNTIEHLLLDQVLPRVLNRKSFLVLHAGAVMTSNGALAFIGKTGFGKSTLTAFLGQHGYPILTDDCLVLQKRKGNFQAFPSYPAVRLNEDTARFLVGNEKQLSRVAEYTGKLRLDPEKGKYISQADSGFLRATLILDSWEQNDNPETVIIQLSMRQAFNELLTSVFRLDPTDKQSSRKEFENLTDLVSSVPSYLLRFDRQHSQLQGVLKAIDELFDQ